MPAYVDITPTYDFYTTHYHGKMTEADFEAALPDSVAEVAERIWWERDVAPYLERCHMAVCAIADAVGNPEARLKSYTAGKVSETYGEHPFSLRAEAAVKRYLKGTGLLRGGQWV